MENILQVKNLSVKYDEFILEPVSFRVERGAILSIIGESGSGKTTIAKAISYLIEGEAAVSGEVIIDGKAVMNMKEEELRDLRMSTFSIVFQNSSKWLNPSLNLESQLKEILVRKYHHKKDIKEKMSSLMKTVGLLERDLKRYPHELSGGMSQKFMVACAIALNPKLIIMDEPTSSLDVKSRDELIKLVHRLNKELGIGFLIITHDLKVASDLSDRVIVLYGGRIMEEGKAEDILETPRHPYTRGLIRASIAVNPIKDIWGIRVVESSNIDGCPFCDRCTQSIKLCEERAPKLQSLENNRWIACNRGGIIKTLEGRNISKAYGKHKVLENINISAYSGEIVSIIGESGVGKSTLAKIIGGFLSMEEAGYIIFNEKYSFQEFNHSIIGGIQMVFQDSERALNPYMTVKEVMHEPLKLSKAEVQADAKVRESLRDTGLSYDDIFLEKKIKNLSGGQKQRVNIARALVMEPTIMIADEPTSMLDPSSKANIIRMLKGLQNKKGFTMIMISHDLDSVLKISDRIYVLNNGELSEVKAKDYVEVNIENIFKFIG